MRARSLYVQIVLVACMLLALQACSSAPQPGRLASAGAGGEPGPMPAPIQCVPFVRELSGVQIYGNAYTWWDSAAQQGYQRGQTPMQNAVLVLKRSDRLSNGHVAMVRRIIDSRHIEVTHANWGMDERTRRLVHDSMPAADVSPDNDWSQVEFFNEQAGVFGQPYTAWGFIYPKNGPPV